MFSDQWSFPRRDMEHTCLLSEQGFLNLSVYRRCCLGARWTKQNRVRSLRSSQTQYQQLHFQDTDSMSECWGHGQRGVFKDRKDKASISWIKIFLGISLFFLILTIRIEKPHYGNKRQYGRTIAVLSYLGVSDTMGTVQWSFVQTVFAPRPHAASSREAAFAGLAARSKSRKGTVSLAWRCWGSMAELWWGDCKGQAGRDT